MEILGVFGLGPTEVPERQRKSLPIEKDGDHSAALHFGGVEAEDLLEESSHLSNLGDLSVQEVEIPPSLQEAAPFVVGPMTPTAGIPSLLKLQDPGRVVDRH
jgi:hypothetical protein